MTGLSSSPNTKKLGLVIDLDICVGCHACAVNCKEWNSGGHSKRATTAATKAHGEFGSTESTHLKLAANRTAKLFIFQDHAYIVKKPTALQYAPQARLIKEKKTG